MRETKMRGCPVKFRIMGFQPVSPKDDIVGPYVHDVEFGMFLMVVVVECLDTDSLDGRISNRASLVGGTVDVFDGQGLLHGSEGQGVSFGKGGVDDHSFSTAIEQGGCTDFLSRSFSDKGHFQCDRRRTYISYGSPGYRFRVKHV
jgi:hypothetical protein